MRRALTFRVKIDIPRTTTGEVNLEKEAEQDKFFENGEEEDQEGEKLPPVIKEEVEKAPLSPDALLKIPDVDDNFIERVNESAYPEFLKTYTSFKDAKNFKWTKSVRE